MRTKNFLKHLILGALLLITCRVIGQSTTPGNVAAGPGDFLGWDNTATNNFPLMIRHDANQPIQWFTDSLQRMVLTNTDTNATVNGFDSLDLSGFLGVGHFNSIPGDRPLTFVHISDTGTFAAGYRPWMRAGLLVTDRSDAMYFGTKNDQGNDRRDAVINWSDNLEYAPQWGPDALRFIFTRAADSTNVASENDGLELMRMVPHIGGNEGFVGIGDFKSAAATPDERLDILDRTIRLRAFVDSIAYRNDSLLRVLVVDSTDGRVYWRPIAGMGDGCSSGWMLNGNDPVTAFDGNICPPQSIDRVGIGTDKPEAKLHVRKDTTNGLNTERAGFFHNVITASTGIGMDALAEGQGSQWNIGGRGIARNSGRSVGLWGIAEGDLPNTTNTGVRAEAFSSPTHNLGVSSWASGGTNATGVTATGIGGSDLSTGGSFMGSSSVTTTGVKASATSGSLFTYGVQGQGTGGGRAYGLWGSASAGQSLNYGVYGTATGPGWSTVYAGYFNGDVMAFGGTYQGSDAALKTGITDVVAADQPDVVAQLQLHTYHYDHEAHPALNMPQGEQLGLLADELEELLPGLVKQSVQPAVLDSVGNEVHPEVEFKAVNYTGLIPHLVLAIQQQQARIDELTELVQACCTADTKATDPNDLLNGDGTPAMDPAMDRLLTIAPNPFTDHTTVHYTLERPGRAQLLVNSADGRHIAVLHEGVMPAGAHRYEWSTAHLAPGVHYVTLLLDGEHVVKRAVKVR